MKIFYKKDFQRVLGEYKNLQSGYKELLEKYNNNDYQYFEDYCKCKDKSERLTKKNEEYKTINATLKNKVIELEAKVKQLNGSKGGYKTTIKKLTKENEELKLMIEDLKSDRYLIKKIPEGRIPKGEMIKAKGSRQSNQTKKLLKEKEDLKS